MWLETIHPLLLEPSSITMRIDKNQLNPLVTQKGLALKDYFAQHSPVSSTLKATIVLI